MIFDSYLNDFSKNDAILETKSSNLGSSLAFPLDLKDNSINKTQKIETPFS